ncbi:MAG TPA: tyrosine/phenylalanine carboxypeptidase domain-containing protein, partial [Anaeromyxobacter sp.]
ALAHHEGLWHVLTSLNGLRQPVLTVLGVGLPRFTESQEGGGIVAEFLTGNITDERYIELGERTIAIDMAARGADFLEVYRYLLARFPPEKAALMSERVFRGGVLEGGAPFTKDAAYQRGYCRTFNFLRAALEQRDLDLVRAFLAGKMSVDDAELVRDLVEEGTCAGPVYLPEWFIDIDRLNAIATHSVTMNRFSLPSVTRYYAARRKDGRAAGELVATRRAPDSEEPPALAAADEGDLEESAP